jgi:hypothetical protein
MCGYVANDSEWHISEQPVLLHKKGMDKRRELAELATWNQQIG